MAEKEAASGIKVLYLAYIENILNTFLSDTKRLGIRYVASPSGTLPSLFKLWFCGQNGIVLEVTEFMRLLLFFDSFSRCHGFVCSL